MNPNTFQTLAEVDRVFVFSRESLLARETLTTLLWLSTSGPLMLCLLLSIREILDKDHGWRQVLMEAMALQVLLPMLLLFGASILLHDLPDQMNAELPVVSVASDSQLQNCRVVVLKAANVTGNPPRE